MRGTNNLRSGEPWTRCTRRSGPCRPLTWWPATWPSWMSSKGDWRSEADSQKLLDWDRCRRDLCDLRKRENWKNLYEWNLNIHEILILMGDKISYIIIIPIPIPIDHEIVLFLVNLYIDFRKFSCHPYLRSKNTRSRRLRLRSLDMSNNDHIFHRLHWNIDWCGQRKGQELNKSHQVQNILLSNLGTRCQGRDTELRLAHTQLTPTA